MVADLKAAGLAKAAAAQVADRNWNWGKKSYVRLSGYLIGRYRGDEYAINHHKQPGICVTQSNTTSSAKRQDGVYRQ
jgi:hypothetical protein